MTTVQDEARKVVADHAENFYEEHQFNDMLGLLGEPTTPRLWTVHCADRDCADCHRKGATLVEAPFGWDEERVLGRLKAFNHTCGANSNFTIAVDISDDISFAHLIIADITL